MGDDGESPDESEWLRSDSVRGSVPWPLSLEYRP
jgi:hypothetical protein